MKLIKNVFLVLLVIVLAACSAQGNAPDAVESPDIITPAPSPPASPTAQPTEMPVATPSPTAPSESVFIVSDDVWAGAKEFIPSEGDWLAGGFVYVAPGGEIRSPYDAMASLHKFTAGEITYESVVLTIEPNKSEDFSDLAGESYALMFQVGSITPAFSQYEMVKEGQVIGTVNSSDFPDTPEQLKRYGLSDYNLYIGCQIDIRSFGIEEPFSDELTLKDKIKFIVDLAKEAQTEETEED